MNNIANTDQARRIRELERFIQNRNCKHARDIEALEEKIQDLKRDNQDLTEQLTELRGDFAWI